MTAITDAGAFVIGKQGYVPAWEDGGGRMRYRSHRTHYVPGLLLGAWRKEGLDAGSVEAGNGVIPGGRLT